MLYTPLGPGAAHTHPCTPHTCTHTAHTLVCTNSLPSFSLYLSFLQVLFLSFSSSLSIPSPFSLPVLPSLSPCFPPSSSHFPLHHPPPSPLPRELTLHTLYLLYHIFTVHFLCLEYRNTCHCITITYCIWYSICHTGL